jgi:phage repressor protein C with HTH and peptisase S24 domain
MDHDFAEVRRRRLVEARERAGYKSARDAAAKNGWPESTYRAHENGTRTITVENAVKYADAFGVDAAWIYGTTQGNLFKVVKSSLTSVLPNMGQRKDTAPLSARRLNVLGRAAGSPEGELIMSGEAVDTVAGGGRRGALAGAYAVYVIGDSMEPRYRAGELVYVHPNKPYRRGDYVVVQVDVDGEDHPHGFVKQFQTLTPTTLVLKQINPERELEFPREKVLSIHRIVMSGDS